MPRPTIAEIDLAAVRDNLRAIRALTGPAVEIIGMVKADAYGHGAVEVASVLASEGAKWLAVSSVDEGITLRRAGIDCRVLIMAGVMRFRTRIKPTVIKAKNKNSV